MVETAQNEFGISGNTGSEGNDLGGPKDKPPALSESEKLVEERVKKHQFVRGAAKYFCIFIGSCSAACLLFTGYIIFHFFSVVDKAAEHDIKSAATSQIVIINQRDGGGELKYVQSGKDKDVDVGAGGGKAGWAKGNDKDNLPDPTARMFAPLIPASLTGALGLILLVTLARFITNYSNAEDTPRQQEYGAITTLVQELGKLFKSFKGE